MGRNALPKPKAWKNIGTNIPMATIKALAVIFCVGTFGIYNV